MPRKTKPKPSSWSKVVTSVKSSVKKVHQAVSAAQGWISIATLSFVVWSHFRIWEAVAYIVEGTFTNAILNQINLAMLSGLLEKLSTIFKDA